MIDENRVIDFLDQRRIPIRLSCILPSGFPLVLSLWYYFDGQYIYALTEKSSKLYRYLELNKRVGFEIAGDQPPYCGIRGYGKISLSDDKHKEMTERLYSRYFKNLDSKLFKFLTSGARNEVIIKIEIINWYTWNFTERMRDSIQFSDKKICP